MEKKKVSADWECYASGDGEVFSGAGELDKNCVDFLVNELKREINNRMRKEASQVVFIINMEKPK